MQVFAKVKEQFKKKKVWIPALILVLVCGLGATAHRIWFPEEELYSWHDTTDDLGKTDGGTYASGGSSNSSGEYGSSSGGSMATTPEPGTLILLGSGLASLALWKRKFSK
jgi:hypothetical protein